MLITPNYAELNARLHDVRPDYGTSGQRWAATVDRLANWIGACSILDYGCGKQTLAAALPQRKITGYDPALPGLDIAPSPADLVVCTDVLEHVEPECIEEVLDDLCRITSKLAFVTVATRPAVKTLADGRNAHLTVQPLSWWRSRFESRFDILQVRELKGSEFALVLVALHADMDGLGPLDGLLPADASPSQPPTAPPANMEILHREHRLIFQTPNQMTRWRVQTLLEKEPHTIHWLERIPLNSVLLDVGANVGMYSIFAGVTRKARVFAFEPESQNFALLNQNIAANALSGRAVAYPLALSDQTALAPLYLSSVSAGGSCHSFGAEVGFDLRPRSHAFAQGSFATTIDQLVATGAIPCPAFIKIDVDGLEHKVIRGARQTLADPRVQEILIELNTHLQEHLDVIDILKEHGFEYDPAQSASSLRKSGAFEGVGEFIFRRKERADAAQKMNHVFSIHPPRNEEGWKVLQHMIGRIADAELVADPFPYLVLDKVFPEDYYAQMLENFPALEHMRPLSESGRVARGLYEQRHALLFQDGEFERLTNRQAGFWKGLADWLYSDPFANAVIAKFHQALQPRMSAILKSEDRIRARGDALLVEDHTQYAIGPHTDAPHRLVTFLFYLPEDDSMRDLGTSIYKPRNSEFTCWGGPHHPFDQFERTTTVEFLPNRLLAFPKTDRSFHGVEPIEREQVRRRLLINNVRLMSQTTR